MKPSIYVAAKWEAKDRARAAIAAVQDAGFIISHDWTLFDETGLDGDALCAFRERCAIRDALGVTIAHAFILLDHPALCAGNTELGMALGRGIPVVIVNAVRRDDGGYKNVFAHLPLVVHVESIAAAIAYLKDIFHVGAAA